MTDRREGPVQLFIIMLREQFRWVVPGIRLPPALAVLPFGSGHGRYSASAGPARPPSYPPARLWRQHGTLGAAA